MSIALETPGQRIRFLREDVRGWSMRTLAKKINVSHVTIYHWENDHSLPNRHSQLLLAEELGSTRMFLFGDKAA